MTSFQALAYLDDIAHGREMDLDPHELKLFVGKYLKALDFLIGFQHITEDDFFEDDGKYYFMGRRVSDEEYGLLKETLICD